MTEKTTNILLGCTGSVASLKIPALVNKLHEIGGYNVRVVATKYAQHFYSIEDLPSDVAVLTDEEEWSKWQHRGDPVLHIELRKWADIFVIAPLDANTLAKIALGLCDNLLTCIARAWDFKKPFFFCPAMNTLMWEHPITATHIQTLKQWGYKEVPVVSKTLICGDVGNGAMADVDTIISAITKYNLL